MPFEADGDSVQAPRIDVRPSAVLELTWALNLLHWHSELPNIDELRESAPELRDEFESLWDDGLGCLPDTSVLAERIGALLLDEADTFLDGLERASRLDGVGLELRSESPRAREATLARLDALRRDPVQRRHYTDLLRRVWEVLRPAWETTGRDVVHHACADWMQRLRQGTSYQDLFPGKHLAHSAAQEALLAQRPRIVLSPMYFVKVGGFVIDMTSFMHIGGSARPADVERLRREESELIANRLKVLADGTRVSLLRELALEPASVMDLARRFHLAQPTVSNHVRMLREAGLLESRKDGARVVYSAPRERLDRVLADTRHLLLEH